MKRPTAASLKKVTAENLGRLGAERLAEILVSAAETRPELKRRLRMELAAEQGADHLVAEIDRRLGTLGASRSRVSWRQRPTFVRDLDVLRVLIAERLAALDGAAALDRMWSFMELGRPMGSRVKDRDGELAAVFQRAAADIGGLMRGASDAWLAEALVEAMVKAPYVWADWLPTLLGALPPDFAAAALRLLAERPGAVPGWIRLIRLLADAADDADAYRSTFPAEALQTKGGAAEVARRLLAAGRVAEAGEVLDGARNAKGRAPVGVGAADDPDYQWEGLWIDWLERSGDADAAQAARWASFERSLSVERAKAFTRRLADFEDVVAEDKAFAYAAEHADAARGLQFLIDWPALAQAARMIDDRADAIQAPPDQVELWAAKLRPRYPAAAQLLLRQAAAAAFRRRDLKTCDRLTQEADAIGG